MLLFYDLNRVLYFTILIWATGSHVTGLFLLKIPYLFCNRNSLWLTVGWGWLLGGGLFWHWQCNWDWKIEKELISPGRRKRAIQAARIACAIAPRQERLGTVPDMDGGQEPLTRPMHGPGSSAMGYFACALSVTIWLTLGPDWLPSAQSFLCQFAWAPFHNAGLRHFCSEGISY